MKQPSVSSIADPEIWVRFQSQLAEARETPVLSRLVRRPTADLYPRYSGYYRQLCQLPRRVRRQLQRQWRRSLSAIALLLALGQAPALAATINVDGTNCTLAEAIRSANTNTAVGGCTKGSGADTIVLPIGSTQSLTAVNNTNTTRGPTGLPVIRSTVTLQGRNSTIRRESGAPEFRILAVDSSGDLTLHSTTVSGGGGDYGGAGVFNSGTATLTNSIVSGNSGARFGGAGGVSNYGTLTLMNSTVSGNSSFGYDCCRASAGVYNSGTLALTNSTVSGNSGDVGGVSNYGTATVTNSTVSGNDGVFLAGGIDNRGTLTLARTLISGNENRYGRSEVGNFGTVVANNHNLFGRDGDAAVVGFSPGPTDLVPNARLRAILNTTLADNSGPTRTHALPAGSPAIGQSPANRGCRPTDQRGVTRPQGAACDIGAFEKGPPVRCGGRLARILGTVGNDSLLSGTPGPDVIHGLAGRDTIDGLEGNDIICGGTGGDELFGASGADRLNGGSGSDICRGGSGTDTGVSCETATSIP